MPTPAPPAPPPITSKTPPPRSAPPPPRPNGNDASRSTPKKFEISSGIVSGAERVGIVGTGGIGKTELAVNIRKQGLRPLVADIGKGSNHQNVERIDTIETWSDLRDMLHSAELLAPYGAIIIDDVTKAEELASAHVIKTIPHEKGHFVNGIEGYGFGKGFTHTFEMFLLLLGDLDAVVRSGKWVICIAHDCTSEVPNPSGEDYLRYEPRLQSPASGKGSIRHRFKEWLDHMVFIGYDVAVNEQGIAIGGGTRTIYPTERPFCLAKSRTLSEAIPYDRGSDLLWEKLLKGEGEA